MLPKPFFVRVDRSLIIRLQAVKKVVAQARDEVLSWLKDSARRYLWGDEVPSVCGGPCETQMSYD